MQRSLLHWPANRAPHIARLVELLLRLLTKSSVKMEPMLNRHQKKLVKRCRSTGRRLTLATLYDPLQFIFDTETGISTRVGIDTKTQIKIGNSEV